jgi:hypothetical protein
VLRVKMDQQQELRGASVCRDVLWQRGSVRRMGGLQKGKAISRGGAGRGGSWAFSTTWACGRPGSSWAMRWLECEGRAEDDGQAPLAKGNLADDR